MELKKLFEMQRKLDERIIKEKGLEGQNLLPKKILALQVELGELANEWQGFKHWKVNPQPKDGMLEEYVDCLHFFLSIGNDLDIAEKIESYTNIPEPANNTVKLFTITIMDVGKILFNNGYVDYIYAWYEFKKIGKNLGFTWEQITQAYIEKNKVNHERQENGY